MKSVKTRLECRSGLFLAVSEAGLIQGIEDAESPATVFFLIPVGLRVVALQNESTSGYIAMNSEGRMYTTVVWSDPVYVLTPKSRNSSRLSAASRRVYSRITGVCTRPFSINTRRQRWTQLSCQQMTVFLQRPWHLGINSKGKCIKGMRAKKDRPASHFLPRPIESKSRWACWALIIIRSAVMMREPVEADDLLVRSIQPTRSNSFNNEGENDLRMLPWFINKVGFNVQNWLGVCVYRPVVAFHLFLSVYKISII